MIREQYIKEFKKFTLQDQHEIMTALMPDFCQTMMSNPAQMQKMILMCSHGPSMLMNWGMPQFGKGAYK